jgi:hypothetical protein
MGEAVGEISVEVGSGVIVGVGVAEGWNTMI